MCRQLGLLLKLAPYHGWSPRRIALPGLGATAYARSLSCYARAAWPPKLPEPCHFGPTTQFMADHPVEQAGQQKQLHEQLAASPKAENDLE